MWGLWLRPRGYMRPVYFNFTSRSHHTHYPSTYLKQSEQYNNLWISLYSCARLKLTTMANAANLPFPAPLQGYENAPPLPDSRTEDGKSYVNPPTGVLSPAYSEFVDPLDNGRRGGLYLTLSPSTIPVSLLTNPPPATSTSTTSPRTNPKPNTPKSSGSASGANSQSSASTSSGIRLSARTPRPCSR